MRLYLVRHGQTAWNEAGRAQGHTDIPLDARGLAQARCLGTAFAAMDVDRILSSDLQRAAATAEAIAGSTGAPVEVRTLLRERSFGEWEGTDFGQVGHRTLEQAAQLGLSPLEVRPPGGESLFDVWDRLAPVEAELRGLSGTTVVSTHGGTLGLLLARLVNGTVATARSFRFGNTSITELERRPDGFLSIVRYNCVLHLDSMPSLAGSVDGTGR